MYGRGIDARTIMLGVWMDPQGLDFRDCYSASDAFEQAIVAPSGVVAGKIIKGFTTHPPQGMAAFGLRYRVRRIADVDTLVSRQIAKRKSDAAAREAAKSYKTVTTLEFDKNWELVSKTIENRTVYSNKSGGMRIKTRSHGSPVVHEYEGKHYVIYAVNMNNRTVNQKVWTEALPSLLDTFG